MARAGRPAGGDASGQVDADQARDLHLADADDGCDLGLRETVDEPRCHDRMSRRVGSWRTSSRTMCRASAAS